MIKNRFYRDIVVAKNYKYPNLINTTFTQSDILRKNEFLKIATFKLNK